MGRISFLHVHCVTAQGLAPARKIYGPSNYRISTRIVLASPCAGT